ncbi:hypothetical protein ILYODFUR_020569 [Ilyodon furcidens]|uniref:Reverse transcriptase domain-containing protein n=1 Tax=Ilyodon furcidens TaxID=33524 RepID=A0ABV0U8U2_9TELE
MAIFIGETQHKICAFADDILMTLTCPETGLLRVLSILEKVGSYPGYTLNTSQLEGGHSTTYVKIRWEKEATIKITGEDWLNICKTVIYFKLRSVERVYMEKYSKIFHHSKNQRVPD